MRRILIVCALVVVAVAAGAITMRSSRAQALEPDAMPALAAANLRADLAELGRVRLMAQPIVDRVAAVCQQWAVRLPDCGNCDGRTVPCDQVEFASGKIARPPAREQRALGGAAPQKGK